MADIMTEYEALLEEYSDTVTRLCILHTGSMTDAEDCYQNVFFKLYKQLKKGSLPNPKAWLLRVTVNCSVNFFRSAWRRHVQTVEALPERASPLIDDARYESLNRALDSLPARYRAVIHLYYYEEMSVDEISAVINTKPATIRSRLARGRERLKRELIQNKEANPNA